MKIVFNSDSDMLTIEVDKSYIPNDILSNRDYFIENNGNLEGFITFRNKYIIRLITKI